MGKDGKEVEMGESKGEGVKGGGMAYSRRRLYKHYFSDMLICGGVLSERRSCIFHWFVACLRENREEEGRERETEKDGGDFASDTAARRLRISYVNFSTAKIDSQEREKRFLY